MRTADELVTAALTLRNRLRDEGKDPLEAVFHVTHDEWSVLKMMPWPTASALMSPVRDRLCGLKLEAV
jgi:hypothetical protein